LVWFHRNRLTPFAILTKPLNIAPGMVAAISMEIKGKAVDGTEKVFQKRNDDRPFYFLVGQVDMLPRLEDALLGLSAGDPFDLNLTMDQAYGPHLPEKIAELPRDMFLLPDGRFDDRHVAPGKILNLEDEHSRTHRAEVISVGEQSVRMDFNHPFAGYSLHCTGVVVAVRAATTDERAHGHVHGPGGVQH